MSDGVSVDANVMALFAKSFLPNKADTDVLEVKEVVGKIRSTVGFVIDSGGKIQHQWSATCGWKTGNPVREWFVQSARIGTISPVVALVPEVNGRTQSRLRSPIRPVRGDIHRCRERDGNSLHQGRGYALFEPKPEMQMRRQNLALAIIVTPHLQVQTKPEED